MNNQHIYFVHLSRECFCIFYPKRAISNIFVAFFEENNSQFFVYNFSIILLKFPVFKWKQNDLVECVI